MGAGAAGRGVQPGGRGATLVSASVPPPPLLHYAPGCATSASRQPTTCLSLKASALPPAHLSQTTLALPAAAARPRTPPTPPSAACRRCARARACGGRSAEEGTGTGDVWEGGRGLRDAGVQGRRREELARRLARARSRPKHGGRGWPFYSTPAGLAAALLVALPRGRPIRASADRRSYSLRALAVRSFPNVPPGGAGRVGAHGRRGQVHTRRRRRRGRQGGAGGRRKGGGGKHTRERARR
jgi:hypothetical protein